MDPLRSSSRSTINVTLPSQHSGSAAGSAERQLQAKKQVVVPDPEQDKQLTQLLAARSIERCWCSYRDKQMFKLLKHAVCAAEHSMTYEILRKVAPNEAHLLKDKSMKARVRFRFAGSEFPPVILFKIFTHTEGHGLKYFSGKKIIKPASDASADACREMGHRKFYDQMLADTCQHERDKITDEIDVTTVKDYMQYLSNLDEMPAYMGGRENLWRKLDLNVLPRTTILYDIIDYLNRGSMSDRLRPEIRLLTSRPLTQEMQLKHIKLISKLRTPLLTPIPAGSLPPSRGPSPGVTSRRSRQAKQRASKMRKMYMSPTEDPDMVPQNTARTERLPGPGNHQSSPTPRFDHHVNQDAFDDEDAMDGDMEGWEDEADKLYTWTQNLSMEDIGFMTPS
ncbi:putative uncharacterized protein CXorf58 [Strongylocentrotus purpuratus]|uniref:Uncharacterized protein n=1 Tax=Strongylocentrotus purpuratus TaxID=7668 RepID=A0A7M7NK75_STRPU|nr:putative uncharacterized protein CXorf58 [Strongylocentrotus purpuratus]XP_797875.3 putative uncharacterized protein CXorf58 [Strongylocentrotus purpuratus]|eukprot:XP_797875.3 PREDICTED: putative uncharacterized protein CXorf58 [Strongylocentrotus purpuratus]